MQTREPLSSPPALGKSVILGSMGMDFVKIKKWIDISTPRLCNIRAPTSLNNGCGGGGPFFEKKCSIVAFVTCRTIGLGCTLGLNTVPIIISSC